MDTVCFDVLRRCFDCNQVCEAGCNCDHVTVSVEVDELTEAELAHFGTSGAPSQQVEVAAYLGDFPAARAA